MFLAVMVAEEKRPAAKPADCDSVPPPGRRLDFDAWCRALTAELRRFIPEVAASSNGCDRVTWRYGGDDVIALNDRGCYRIQLNPRFGDCKMPIGATRSPR